MAMDGSTVARPPGGRGAAGPLRVVDGCDPDGGAPVPRAAGNGGREPAAPGANAGLAVPDGGSVAAGSVWGALLAARDDEALSAADLAARAGASQADTERALERFAAAELVLRVPRGRRAAPGWMLAGGVRAGLGIAQTGSDAGGYGHGPALPMADAAPRVPEGEGPAAVAGANLPAGRMPSAVPVRKPPRLAKGELEARVLAALRARYPEEFGPLALSREIGGYSSGAVSNALERLHAKGRVLQTCLAPKRYAALPPEAADTAKGDAA